MFNNINNKIHHSLHYYLFKFRMMYKKMARGTKRSKEDYRLYNNIEWFGTDYGGFFLDKTLVSKKTVLFSFGIGTDISFDRCVANLGVRKLYLFDPTPKAIAFIKEQRLPDYYRFLSYGLSAKDETTEFFLPTIPGHISGSKIFHDQLGKGESITVELKKLSTICNDLKIETPDILKLDIEGSEFDVLKDIFESKIFPKQVCIEFHSRFFEDGSKKLENSIQLFNRHGYIMGGKSTEEEYLFIKADDK
jgi:FkbM family methyltransferase